MQAYSTFFFTLPFSALNTLDQTVEISISPPAHGPSPLPRLCCEEDLDIVLSDTNPDSESNEEITIVSFEPAPGPSGSTTWMAIIPYDAIVISKSEPESDVELEDMIVVSLFHPSLSSRSLPHCQQIQQPDVGQTATASGVKLEDHDIKQEHSG